MKIVGDPDKDFFDQNPELKYIPEFKQFRAEHKKPSRLLWAVYFMCDPKSQFYKIPEEARRQEISRTYLEDENFDWEIVSELEKAWPRLILTKAEINYDIWASKLDQLTVYLKELQFGEHDQLILNILDKSEKIWSSFKKVEALMKKEEKTTGSVEESGLEKDF